MTETRVAFFDASFTGAGQRVHERVYEAKTQPPTRTLLPRRTAAGRMDSDQPISTGISRTPPYRCTQRIRDWAGTGVHLRSIGENAALS
jgi:hypothetical protein